MPILIGKRADGILGLFVSPHGVDARTCNLNDLTFNVYEQVQVFKAGKQTFTSNNNYGSDFYKVDINVGNQGFEPMVHVHPYKNKDSITGASGEFRADQDVSRGVRNGVPRLPALSDFKFKVHNGILTVIAHKENYSGFGYQILNRPYGGIAPTSTNNVTRIWQKHNGHLLISRPGENVTTINPNRALFNSDLAGLRKWSEQSVNIAKSSTGGGGNYQTLSPVSGVSMSPKMLGMFRPSDGSHVYEFPGDHYWSARWPNDHGLESQKYFYTANGYLMNFVMVKILEGRVIGTTYTDFIADWRWGALIEDVQYSPNIRVGCYSHFQNMQVNIAVFHNNLGG